jgi:hypothetical protein
MPHSSQKNVNAPMDAWDRQRCGLALLEIVEALAVIHPDDRRMEHAREAVLRFIDERETGEMLGRFGHHPDPVIDFCTEVDVIEGLFCDMKACGVPTKEELNKRVARAMLFSVGGDQHSIDAKAQLRWIAELL